MSYAVLLMIAAVAPFALASAIGSIAVWLSWPRVSHRLARLPPSRRAHALLVLRVVPLSLGVLSAVIVFPRFAAGEPATSGEHPGVLLITLCVVTIAMLLSAIVRAVGNTIRARAWLRMVRARGESTCLGTSRVPALCVDGHVPVMALVGCIRPQIVASRELLEHVTADEIDVMLRHELAHRSRHDNVVSALFHLLPDPLGYTKRGHEIADSWRRATEEAADDLAAASEPTRLMLAAGLVRLARLAHGALPDIAASPLLSHSFLERRIRRLLGPSPSATHAGGPSAAVLLLFGLTLFGALIAQDPLRNAINVIIETAINGLP